MTLTIHGRVQGVFFRASTRERASALEVTGYVRNQPDGTVFLVAEGPRPALDALLGWIDAGGPGAARVDGRDLARAPATGEFIGFSVVR